MKFTHQKPSHPVHFFSKVTILCLESFNFFLQSEKRIVVDVLSLVLTAVQLEEFKN